MSLLFASTASSQVYRLIELPMQYAQDINDSGVVVGDAVIWENGVWIGTGPVYGDGINNKKQVAGSALVSADTTHAFLWEDFTLTDIGTLGGRQAIATAINNSTEVAGYSFSSTAHSFHPFFWKNGVMTDIDTPGIAEGINNLGQVVGTFSPDDTLRHAFMWQDGNISDLGALPGAYISNARAINNAGQVVGTSSLDGNGGAVAVIWTGGGIVNLGRFLDSVWSGSDAFDINDGGEVVGSATVGGFYYSPIKAAFIWKNGIMTDLNSVTDTGGGWHLDRAMGINNQGDIICWAGRQGNPYIQSVLLRGNNIVITRPKSTDFWITGNSEKISWLAPKGKSLSIYYTEDFRPESPTWTLLAGCGKMHDY